MDARRRRFRAPGGGRRARLLDRLANAAAWRAVRRQTIGRLPFPRLCSDVTDVLYANWLVPAIAAAPVVPRGVRLVERDGLTLLTVLSYRHGHFGPSLAGPLRRLFPSPLQSNWRLYVDRIDGAAPPVPAVLFVANIFGSTAYALGTRLFSDALPSHLAARFMLERTAGGTAACIDGGDGSAPSLDLRVRSGAPRRVPEPFAAWFGNGRDPYATICLQDAAVTATPPDRLAAAWIDLPIDLDAIEPLAVESCRPGRLLADLGAVGDPWCFRVPAVRFTVRGERLLDRAGGGDIFA